MMEIIFGIIIILLAMYVIGVTPSIIIGIVIGGLCLVNLILFIFFLICAIELIGAKKHKAVFSRIGRKNEKGFERAFYIIDGREGEEFPNAFPCEIAMRDSLYRKDRQVTVRLSEKAGIVFDGNAFPAAVTGLVFFTAVCIAAVVFISGI